MKTIFNLSIAALFSLCLLVFASCDNDESADVTKPEINLIEPGEGDELRIGNEHGVH